MQFNYQRIQEVRTQKGMSQAELAKQMGWKSRSAVSQRESGKVEVGANELHRLAQILDVNDLRIFFDN